MIRLASGGVVLETWVRTQSERPTTLRKMGYMRRKKKDGIAAVVCELQQTGFRVKELSSLGPGSPS